MNPALRDDNAIGLGYAICYFPDATYNRGSIDLFGKAVIPALAD